MLRRLPGSTASSPYLRSADWLPLSQVHPSPPRAHAHTTHANTCTHTSLPCPVKVTSEATSEVRPRRWRWMEGAGSRLPTPALSTVDAVLPRTSTRSYNGAQSIHHRIGSLAVKGKLGAKGALALCREALSRLFYPCGQDTLPALSCSPHTPSPDAWYW